MDFFSFVVISPLSSEPFGAAEWKLDTDPNKGTNCAKWGK